MKRTIIRSFAILLCLAVLPLEGFAVWSKEKNAEPPTYMRELSRLVAATVNEDDFGEIQLTVGEPEMEADGETRPITDDENVVPFVDEHDELQIPVEAIGEADLNGSGFLSEEELEEQGYDVQMNDMIGTITITEPYGLCRLIVKTADGKVCDSFGATHEILVSNNRTVLQYSDKSAAKRAAELFEKEQDVLFCEPDRICTVSSTSIETQYKSWGTTAVGADQYIAALPDNLPQITVAVIDTGVDMDHPFLEDRLLENGWDFVQDDDDPDDGHDHGTHCAGIIRDATPDNVKILPIRAMDANGSGVLSVLAEGITYAADSGADILSMSFGGGSDKNAEKDYVLSDAITYALSVGATPIAAAGNERSNLNKSPRYPACCDGVIAVAATDKSDFAADYSNYGSTIDVAAPGSNIVSSVRDGKFAAMSGTSMACPLVAACAALLKSEDSTRTTEELRTLLRERTRDAQWPGRDDHVGSGIVYFGEIEPLQEIYLPVSNLQLEALTSMTLVPQFEPMYRAHTCVSFTSSDPSVVIAEDNGRIHAVQSGTAEITVRSGEREIVCTVTVYGGEHVQISDMVYCSDVNGALLFLGDGTAWAYGNSDMLFGHYSGSVDGSPFRFQTAPGEYLTDVEHYLSNGFLKRDGTFWLHGLQGWRNHKTPIMAVKEDGAPLMGVKANYKNIVFLEDGTVWYYIKMDEPVYRPLCTPEGNPVTGAIPSSLGSYRFTTQSGLAYEAKQNATSMGTRIYTDPAPYFAELQTDMHGDPLRNVKQIGSHEVLYHDGRLINRETGEVILTGVREYLNSSDNRYSPALKLDGTVWDISTGKQILKVDGTPLTNVVSIQDLGMGNFTALCADGTVWAWGYNGTKISETTRYFVVEGYGTLGIGWNGGRAVWDSDNPISTMLGDMKDFSETGYSYEVSCDTALPTNYCLCNSVDRAMQVMIDDDTPLTDVCEVVRSNLYIRSDNSVYKSGYLRYYGYGGTLSEFAVYARPFTLFDRQVYFEPNDYVSPYTYDRAQKIAVSKPHMAATVGETFTLTATVSPANTYERDVRWQSSDTSIAVVDGTGRVTVKKSGFAVIRAYCRTNDKLWGECVLTAEEEAPVRVEMLQYPTVRTFTTADMFSTAGGLLRVTYANGQVRSIFVSPDFCTGYDLSQIGEQTVTVQFAGSTFTYPITVTEVTEVDPPIIDDPPVDPPQDKTVAGIRWEKYPTVYVGLLGGDYVAPDASVRVLYADGSYAVVPLTAEMCSGYDMQEPNPQDVTVTVEGFTISYSLTLMPRLLWEEYPTVGIGVLGGRFVVPEASVRLQNEDGSVTILPLTAEMCSGYDMQQPGEQTVTVTVDGHTISYSLTLIPRLSWINTPETIVLTYGVPLAVPDEMIIVYQDDGSFETVTPAIEMCTGYDPYIYGIQTVMVHYADSTLPFSVAVGLEGIASLEVETLPVKRCYAVETPSPPYNPGTVPDLTGGMLRVTFVDGTEQIVPMTEATMRYTPKRSGAGANLQTVYLDYGELTTTFTIYHIGLTNTEIEEAIITKLPNRLIYEVSQYPVRIDLTGGKIYARTLDGAEGEEDMALFRANENYPVFRATGEYSVYINVGNKQVSFTVTVVEASQPDDPDDPDDPGESGFVPPLKLTWYRKPTKTVYVLGEELDTTGGQFEGYEWAQVYTVKPEMCSGFDPMQPGQQTVTVTFTGTKWMLDPEELAETATLTFDVFVTELVLENEVPEIEVGKCTRILATFAPRDIDEREIIWTSSDETVATVDEYGRVTGIAPGEVTITAQVKDSDAVASCTVTVLPRTGERLPGDADGDGEVTLKDCVQIARYLAGGWDAVIDIANADVNADGEVNLKDVVILRRHLAGGWSMVLK